MLYEVERKFGVSDPDSFRRSVIALGGTWEKEPQRQADHYFRHPNRDFAETDEALRIRSIGPHNFITYKGPKIDQETKTRRELELPLADGAQGAEHFQELLQALGFFPVAVIRKERLTGHILWQGRTVELASDDVDGVGHYAELELQADEKNLDEAKKTLASLAEALSLSAGERKSYLELWLEKNGSV